MLTVFNEGGKEHIFESNVFQILRRTIMRGAIPKLAAAAVIIIAVVLGIYYFKENPQDKKPFAEQAFTVSGKIYIP